MSGEHGKGEQYWRQAITPFLMSYLRKYKSYPERVIGRVFEDLSFVMIDDLSPINIEVVHPHVAARVKETVPVSDRRLWLPSYPDGWLLEQGETRGSLRLKAALECKFPPHQSEQYQSQFIGFTHLVEYLESNRGENGKRVFQRVLRRRISQFGVSADFAYIYIVPLGESIKDLITSTASRETIKEFQFLLAADEIKRKIQFLTSGK